MNELVKHLEISNNKAGFQQLVKTCGTHCRFVIEATGTYDLAVAYYLHEQGGEVAALNPLVIKRFIQTHLSKDKGDRKDAQWPLRYGQQQSVKIWQPGVQALARVLGQAQLAQHFCAHTRSLRGWNQAGISKLSRSAYLREPGTNTSPERSRSRKVASTYSS